VSGVLLLGSEVVGEYSGNERVTVTFTSDGSNVSAKFDGNGGNSRDPRIVDKVFDTGGVMEYSRGALELQLRLKDGANGARWIELFGFKKPGEPDDALRDNLIALNFVCLGNEEFSFCPEGGLWKLPTTSVDTQKFHLGGSGRLQFTSLQYPKRNPDGSSVEIEFDSTIPFTVANKEYQSGEYILKGSLIQSKLGHAIGMAEQLTGRSRGGCLWRLWSAMRRVCCCCGDMIPAHPPSVAARTLDSI
jgi:hypothetical protein